MTPEVTKAHVESAEQTFKSDSNIFILFVAIPLRTLLFHKWHITVGIDSLKTAFDFDFVSAFLGKKLA